MSVSSEVLYRYHFLIKEGVISEAILRILEKKGYGLVGEKINNTFTRRVLIDTILMGALILIALSSKHFIFTIVCAVLYCIISFAIGSGKLGTKKLDPAIELLENMERTFDGWNNVSHLDHEELKQYVEGELKLRASTIQQVEAKYYDDVQGGGPHVFAMKKTFAETLELFKSMELIPEGRDMKDYFPEPPAGSCHGDHTTGHHPV